MTIEKIAGSKVKFEVIIPVDMFKKAIDAAFDKKNKEVEIPGFRKGHAPREAYLARYGVTSLYPDALNDCINETYFEAVEENKINVCGYPKIDLDESKVNEKEPIHYFVTVSVYPEVTLGEYKGLEIVKEKVKVLAKEVDEEIKANLERESMLVKKSGDDVKVEEGDSVVFDYTGTKDGIPFEGGTAKDYTLVIGSHQFIPGFEEQMVGLKVNEEKDLNLKFPDDYHAEELKGQEVVFHVLIKEIKVKDVPELNEEFVKELKLEGVETVDAYKKHIKEEIKERKETKAKNEATNELFKKVIENATFELPDDLVEDEVNYGLEQAKQQANQYKIDVEMLLKFSGAGSVEEYKARLREQAIRTLSLRFVLKEIAKAEKLDSTDEELEEKFDEIAKQYNLSIDQVKAQVSKEAVTEEIVTQKAYKLVEEKNSFVENDTTSKKTTK